MRLMLFIPAYTCAPQIGRVLGQVDPSNPHLAEVFVVDNGSADGTPEAAIAAAARLTDTLPVHVVRNDANYGLGGSHKVAFQRCLDEGYDGLIVFHGDDQGRLSDLLDGLPDLWADHACVLGARFMPGSHLVGYAAHRIAVNIAFNLLWSGLSGAMMWDLGSGLNFYRRDFIEARLWETCADDLTFNYHLILRTVAEHWPIAFVPISWREEDQVSNAKLTRHGVQMLRITRDLALHRRALLRSDHRTHKGPRTWTRIGP